MNFVLDFYCHEEKLGVEVDGRIHDECKQKEYDAMRAKMLNECGVRIIRFTNEKVVHGITKEIKNHLTPGPSPEGDGREVLLLKENDSG